MTRGREIGAPRERSDAGFGLIEVIVALLILSVGILSVSNVLTQSVSMQTITAQRTSALTIAQTAMEQIRATDPLLIVAEPETAVNEDGTPDVNGVFTREVTVSVVSGNVNEVTVIVTAPRSSPVRLVVWVYDGAT
jgi:type IV pilus modification protein PilV